MAVRTGDGPSWGVSRSRTRRADVEHPFHGVNVFGNVDDSILGRCLRYEPVLLPGQFFCHETAALLFGAPLPEAAAEGGLHVAVFDPRTPPRGKGVTGHRVSGAGVSIAHGLPVMSAPDVWFHLSASLAGEDLVALGDYLVTPPRGSTAAAMSTVEQLALACERHAGKRGATRAAWALSRIRVGPQSRPESLLRLLIIAARLPEPTVRFGVGVGGGLTLHPDLAYPDARIAIEYEGDDHRLRRDVWLRDVERRELFEDAGWRVIRVTSRTLFETPTLLIARIRRLLLERSPARAVPNGRSARS